jgi:T5orf172 domain
MDRKGWVYILSNRDLPGVVKIGFTRVSPDRRCSEVAKESPTTGRTPYVLEWSEEFDDCVDGERAVHYLLREHRFGSWELFSVSVADAIASVAEAKRMGSDWKPEDGHLVMLRKSAVGKLSKTSKRLRNSFLYSWLMSNFEELNCRIGTAGKVTDAVFSEVLTEWRQAMGPDYKGRRATEMGLIIEWERVKGEVSKLREFGDRDIIWQVKPGFGAVKQEIT